jgi:hypothetical protein
LQTHNFDYQYSGTQSDSGTEISNKWFIQSNFKCNKLIKSYNALILLALLSDKYWALTTQHLKNLCFGFNLYLF